MMHPKNADIHEYIGGSLDPSTRRSVQQHVDSCHVCQALVADLREIHRSVERLEPITPPAGVWSRVEEALRRGEPSVIGEPTRADRRANAMWWLAVAAAVVLAVAFTIRTGYVSIRDVTSRDPSESAPTTQAVEAELEQAEQHYRKAIAGLEQIAAAESGTLDAATATALQQNLAVVDRAIGESREALRAQPNSEPAQQSLLDSFKAKTSLLQDTVALINEMRKGNEAGVIEVVSGLKKGS